MGVLNKRPKRRALLLAARARLFGFAESFEGNERVGVQVENDGFSTWTQTPAVANEVMLSEVQGPARCLSLDAIVWFRHLLSHEDVWRRRPLGRALSLYAASTLGTRPHVEAAGAFQSPLPYSPALASGSSTSLGHVSELRASVHSACCKSAVATAPWLS